MAAISALAVDFEGTDGTIIYDPAGTPAVNNPGAIGATLIAGGGLARYSAADAQQGVTDLELVGGAGTQVILEYNLTAVTTFWDCFYFKTPSAAPAAHLTIAQWWGNAAVNLGGGVRILTDMTIQIRDNVTSRYISPTPLPTNTWIRVAIKAIPGSATGHRLRVYVGANRHGVTPDIDSGDVAATNGTNTNIDAFWFGLISNGANTAYVDRNRADNATEPAGLSTGAPPTVSAGPDLTKETGSGSFAITGTATASSGATIASRTWAILSGVTVTLSGTTTATVTVTAPTSTTGSTVLRHTATDNIGQSTTDDVTLTWVAPGQTLYPVSDVSNPGAWTTQAGGTTNLYATIDEPVLNTADYIQSPQLTGTAAVYRVRLQGKPAPTNTTGWYLRINKRDQADVISTSLVAKLYEADGTTLRKTWSAITTVNAADTEYQLTLTSGEVAAITTWTSGLIVELSITGS